MGDITSVSYYLGMTRRDFLKLSAVSSLAVYLGCAVNPVTGRQQLMLVSEQGEIEIDLQNSPHQFSADYGSSQDKDLKSYIAEVGRQVAIVTHRPGMPYRFIPVNAAYVNAYAFPGGSIGITRGILLNMESEAELASLIGHELGHVNARHTAEQMTKGIVASLVIAGAAAVISRPDKDYSGLAAGLGQVAAGALLAKYSRDNEREADSLGLDYMIKAGYNPEGQTGLMDMLRGLSKRKPNVIELMFSTHPMSDERYQTVVRSVSTMPAQVRSLPMARERYMDRTANLRRMKEAIEHMQEGDQAMMKRNYREAETLYGSAIKEAPNDYAGLLMMAKCQLVQEKYPDAQRFADKAVAVYPAEAQAYHVRGLAKLNRRRYDAAYDDFDRYEKMLPGNPNTVFFKGLSLEKMGRRDPAAQNYYKYLQQVREGDKAEYAYNRLVEWGYIKPK